MAFIPFVGVVRAVIGQTLVGEPFSNTLWFAKDGYTFADQQILAGVLWSAWASEIAPLMCSQWNLVRVQVYDMTNPNAPVATQSAEAVPGVGATDPIPQHSACVVTLRTAGRGRSARGRIFLAGFGEGSIDLGEFVPSVVQNVVEAIEDVAAAAAAEGWTHVVAQQYAEGQPLAQGFSRPVTAYEVRSGIPGTMRKRLPIR